jgi:hypothetical protein
VEGMLNCSKEHPLDIGQGCAIQEDCVAVEFNIPPANNVDDFKYFINFAKNKLRDMIDDSLEFSFLPSAEFDEQYTTTEQGQEGGCEPDKNIWTGDECKASLEDTNLRVAGGHIHLGYDNPNKETSINFVKVFEVFGTIPTLKYEKKLPAIFRRELYGSAGSYRIKPYGVEYRTLSSWWIKENYLIELLYK